jgi:hypothetical protein
MFDFEHFSCSSAWDLGPSLVEEMIAAVSRAALISFGRSIEIEDALKSLLSGTD